VSAELVTAGRNDHQIESAAGRLGLEPDVTSSGGRRSRATERRVRDRQRSNGSPSRGCALSRASLRSACLGGRRVTKP
jgi:hypothetical protein